MKNLGLITIISLFALDLITWQGIIFGSSNQNPKVYFLNVGQGDSTLVEFPTGVQIITDAGPTKKVVSELEKILDSVDHYIDLAIITHPQLDHFNGFNEILEHYEVGAFIISGREVELPEWKELINKIKNKNIPLIRVAEGDTISNTESRITILNPDKNFIESGELNDTSIVEHIQTKNLKILLTGDIGQNVEKYLNAKFGNKLKSDILKVAHHGSKYSSSEAFLKNVNAKIAVIEVGKNTYGHPTKETLTRLASANIAKVFRTDQNQTILATIENNKLQISQAFDK